MTVSPEIFCYKCTAVIERIDPCPEHFAYKTVGVSSQAALICSADALCHAPNQDVEAEIMNSIDVPCTGHEMPTTPDAESDAFLRDLLKELNLDVPEAVVTAETMPELYAKIENYRLTEQCKAYEETLNAYHIAFSLYHETFGILPMHLAHRFGTADEVVAPCEKCVFDTETMRFTAVCENLPSPHELKYAVRVVSANG